MLFRGTPCKVRFDRNMEGPDHKASLEPGELKQMILSIRHVEQALGSGIKEPSDSEKKNIVIARKSIHLSKDLKKGDIVTDDSLIMLRPGDGIPPSQMEAIIGKKAVRNLKAGLKIDYQDFTN